MTAHCLKLGVALCASLAFAGIGSPAASAQDPVQPEMQDISLLFAQTAERGSLKRKSGGGYHTHLLKLRRAGRQVVWFSDRPSRRTGQIPIVGFLSSWKGFGFAADAPNAALTLLDAKNHEDTVVVELGRGRYFSRRSTVVYPVRIITKATGNLAHLETARDERVARRFGRASLFIDDATAPVINGCVLQPYTSCVGADLSGATLPEAHLSGADLSYANLSGANLYRAYLNSIKLVGTNLTGASIRGATLASAYLVQANFTGADLSGADFPGATLFAANLHNANLTGAYISTANLDQANLTGANLVGANLIGAALHWVDLTGAIGVVLTGATLCQTTMPDGSTSGCRIY